MIAIAMGLDQITWGRSTYIEEEEPGIMVWILNSGKGG
jgi:hypothetical protein